MISCLTGDPLLPRKGKHYKSLINIFDSKESFQNLYKLDNNDTDVSNAKFGGGGVAISLLSNQIENIKKWILESLDYPQFLENYRMAGQDGGVGRCTSSLCTTTGKIKTKLQNKNHPDLSKNQAVSKSDTKDWKKPHASRRVEGVETWRCGEAGRSSRTVSPTSTCGR